LQLELDQQDYLANTDVFHWQKLMPNVAKTHISALFKPQLKKNCYA